MKINIDNYNINYNITEKKDKNIVILQGWGTTMAVYDVMVKALSDRYCVVTLDLPGFGESDEPREAFSVSDYVDFLRKFLKAVGITKASFIGHSYGGRMIIKMAADKEGNAEAGLQIEKLCLVDSAGIKPKQTFKKKLKIKSYKALKRFYNLALIKMLFGDAVNEWQKKQGSEDYRNASPVMKQCLVKAVNEDLTKYLPLIENDTLLIWGDKDDATPLEDGKKMESLIRGSGLAQIKGTGHYCFLENPGVFTNILKVFFD